MTDFVAMVNAVKVTVLGVVIKVVKVTDLVVVVNVVKVTDFRGSGQCGESGGFCGCGQ